jgi:hypothetical protein
MQHSAPSPLTALIQPEQFIGWTCRLDYDQAVVFTSDQWKARARGVPHNCFLLAPAFDARPGPAPADPGEIILLRVTGAAPLPLDDDVLQARIRQLKTQPSPAAESAPAAAPGGGQDNGFQFGGLACRILGTFYLQDGQLRLGSDIESYFQAPHLAVYRPTGPALEAIVNYISPERAAAREEARRLGLRGGLPRFPIGTVRYTSTDRLHRGDPGQQAHNLIGRNEALTDIWPTIAKEGAKARLAIVYATQEVSTIHPNILANTENILVSHLNNENEINELAKYYDFRDFATSLIRAQNVGFARVKTLSNPFVIPVQIDRFDPDRERRRAASPPAA